MAASASGQTVRPLIDENFVKAPRAKVSGRIEYVNDSLEVLTVTIVAESFAVSDKGELTYSTLAPGIRVEFSATSFRIQPRQNYLLFYEASADVLPSWFVVYATFSGFAEKTKDGLSMRVLLPHTVYLLPRGRVQKNDLSIEIAKYDPSSNRVVVRVGNKGPVFCRVLETEITSAAVKVTQNGFPIFPYSERQIEVPWTGKTPPNKLTLRLDRIRLEQDIAADP